VQRAYLSLERARELREFWPSGQPIRVLAQQWGCTISYISVKAKELGLPSRQMTSTARRIRSTYDFTASCDARIYFESEADRRGLSPRELEAMIVQIVSNDRMVTAVLDDEPQPQAESIHA
jgi:hypothetical protein